jgi:hypothetical protein
MAAYTGVSGFDPTQTDASGNNPTDTGALWTDVLARWRTTGFMLGGELDQATAFVRVQHGDDNELRLAVQWFGCALVGLALPLAAQTQAVWDVADDQDGEPGSWGGHAVPMVAYTRDLVWFVTWGLLKPATWAFARRYITEAYAVQSPDWFKVSGKTPAGLTLDAVNADLDEMAAA